MKTPLLYGSLSALVGALVMFGMHFAGFYDSVEKLQSAQTIGNVVSLVTVVTCMVLAIRDRRNDFPADREWGYGSALGTAFLTGLVSTVIGIAVWYLYVKFVNPGSFDVMTSLQTAKMQEAGRTDAEIEAAQKFMGIGIMSVFALVSLTFMSFIVALVVAIFFRKKPVAARSEVAAPPMV